MPLRLAVALDLRVSEIPHTIEQEEQAIAMTASLLLHAEQAGWEISLEVLGCAAPHLPMRRGGRHQLQILDVLAAIDLSVPRSFESVQHDLRQSVVLIIHPGIASNRSMRGDSISISAGKIAAFSGETPDG